MIMNDHGLNDNLNAMMIFESESESSSNHSETSLRTALSLSVYQQHQTLEVTMM